MKCPSCHAENRDDSKFCGNCAAPLGPGAGAGPGAASLTKTLETPVRVLKTGAVIAGKYRIVEEVGAGGMGVVYKAEDIRLQRTVALKFLPANLADSAELIERFLIEARAAAALRAIELDEYLAGAHEALASVRFLIDWDWDGAQESYLRAVELNPNIATAQAMYAHFLLFMGQDEEALAHSKRSIDLDPYNPTLHGLYSFVLIAQRRYDEAVAAIRKALSFQPDSLIGMSGLLFLMHEMEGMEKEAFEAAKALAKAAYRDPKVDAALEAGYARGGYAEAMKSVAETLVARLPEAFAMPSEIASWYALAGEKEKAIEWLEKGLDPHDPVLPYIGCYRCYDDLHPDPRFQELLRKMKLPASQER